MANYTIHWHDRQAILQVEKATEAALAELAFWIEGRTKGNIQQNGQIDTGFMLNSTHTLTKTGGDTYGQARAAATARNPKAAMAPKASLGQAQAAVVVGANYAIYQETKNSFLFKAGRQALAQVGLIEAAYKRRI